MNIDNLRLDMINSAMMMSLVFLFIGCSAFYFNRKEWIGRKLFVGIIITASVIDMGIVDHQVIEPDGGSYRSPTINPRSLKSNYLNKDAVIAFSMLLTDRLTSLSVTSG